MIKVKLTCCLRGSCHINLLNSLFNHQSKVSTILQRMPLTKQKPPLNYMQKSDSIRFMCVPCMQYQQSIMKCVRNFPGQQPCEQCIVNTPPLLKIIKSNQGQKCSHPPTKSGVDPLLHCQN